MSVGLFFWRRHVSIHKTVDAAVKFHPCKAGDFFEGECRFCFSKAFQVGIFQLLSASGVLNDEVHGVEVVEKQVVLPE